MNIEMVTQHKSNIVILLVILILSTSSLFLVMFNNKIITSKLTTKNEAQEIDEIAIQQVDYTQPTTTDPYVKGEVIVKLKNSIDKYIDTDNISINSFTTSDISANTTAIFRLQSTFDQNNVGILSKLAPDEESSPFLSNVFSATIPEDQDIIQTVENLEENPMVEYAQPNYIYTPLFVPNDPFYLDEYNGTPRGTSYDPPFDYQWNLKKINMEKAWDILRPNIKSNVKIAIIDDGVEYSHPELGACTIAQINSNNCDKIAPGWDFGDNDNDPQNEGMDQHGTYVAGVINANTNNNAFLASIAPGVKIMPIRASDFKSIKTNLVVKGIDFAKNNGARVINFSIGRPEYPDSSIDDDRLFLEALEEAFNHNIVLVAGTGNDSSEDNIYFPAKMRCAGSVNCVIAVGSSTVNDTRSFFSNAGAEIDLVAPGGGIYSDKKSIYDYNIILLDSSVNKFRHGYGTSLSTPEVSATAALILTINPSLKPLQVQDIINKSAKDIDVPGFDNRTGWGRLDVAAALEMAKKTVSKGPTIVPRLTNRPLPTITNRPSPASRPRATKAPSTPTPTPIPPRVSSCTFFPVSFVYEQKSDGSYEKLSNPDKKIWGSLNNKIIQELASSGQDEMDYFQRFNQNKGFDNLGEYNPCKIANGGISKACVITTPTCCGYSNKSDRQYDILNDEKAQVKLFYDEDNYEIIDHCFNEDENDATKDTDEQNCKSVSNKSNPELFDDDRLVVGCGLAYRYGWIVKKKNGLTL